MDEIDLLKKIEFLKLKKDEEVLILEIDVQELSMSDEEYYFFNRELREFNDILKERGIDAIYISKLKSISTQVMSKTDSEKFIKLYKEQQKEDGFKDGFLKGSSDFDRKKEYDDEIDEYNAEYAEYYKKGYSRAWEVENR